MNYLLQLNNQMNFTLTGDELDMKDLTDQLNDRESTFLNFGGIVVNKHIVLGVLPINEENK